MALVKYNNNSISSVTALGSLPAGGLNLITTNTISSGVSSSEFTSNINSTYDTYLFKCINMHHSATHENFRVNFSTDGGSNYNVTKTSSAFFAIHDEADTSTNLAYSGAGDLAQSTGEQELSQGNGTENDQCCSGELYLFSPSSTTFVKHYIAKFNGVHSGEQSLIQYTAGYCNTTSAVNAVQFKPASGNIDAGVIKMYGVS